MEFLAEKWKKRELHPFLYSIYAFNPINSSRNRRSSIVFRLSATAGLNSICPRTVPTRWKFLISNSICETRMAAMDIKSPVSCMRKFPVLYICTVRNIQVPYGHPSTWNSVSFSNWIKTGKRILIMKHLIRNVFIIRDITFRVRCFFWHKKREFDEQILLPCKKHCAIFNSSYRFRTRSDIHMFQFETIFQRRLLTPYMTPNII